MKASELGTHRQDRENQQSEELINKRIGQIKKKSNNKTQFTKSGQVEVIYVYKSSSFRARSCRPVRTVQWDPASKAKTNKQILAIPAIHEVEKGNK